MILYSEIGGMCWHRFLAQVRMIRKNWSAVGKCCVKPIRRLPTVDDADDRMTDGGCRWPKGWDGSYWSLPIDCWCRWSPIPMKKGVEVAKEAKGVCRCRWRKAWKLLRRQQRYTDEAEPMKGFIVIEANTRIDRWMFSIFIKICLM